MTTLAQWLGVIWPIAVTLIPIILLGGLYWLKSQFASQADLNALDQRVTANSDLHIECKLRIKQLDDDARGPPSRNDLSTGIAHLGERMSRVEAGIEAVQRTAQTQADYLHTLVEQGMRR